MPKPLLLLFLLLLTGGAVHAAELRDGDIIFQSSRSAQSLAIQQATHSPYSHMGIVFLRSGKPYVFEAVQTVRYTPLEEWTARGEGRHFVVKRLRDAERILTPNAVTKLRQVAAGFQGKAYDLTFAWSDDRLYCSELVWKIYQRGLGLRLGKLQRLGDFDLSPPVVQAKLRERYGDAIPREEEVISPQAVFAAAELTMVAEY